MPAALDEGHLRKDLEKAGHRVRSVVTRQELDTALDTGSYDLVLTDIKSAPAVETEAKGRLEADGAADALQPLGRRHGRGRRRSTTAS